MKKMKLCLPLVLLLASCISRKSYTVEVQNLSTKRFDSVHLFTNANDDQAPPVKYGSLSPGWAIPPMDVTTISTGGNNKAEKIAAIFYAADTVIKVVCPKTAKWVQMVVTGQPLIAACK
jgi:hypothetical protein